MNVRLHNLIGLHLTFILGAMCIYAVIASIANGWYFTLAINALNVVILFHTSYRGIRLHRNMKEFDRIRQMVDDGVISREEAIRLIENLREELEK